MILVGLMGGVSVCRLFFPSFCRIVLTDENACEFCMRLGGKKKQLMRTVYLVLLSVLDKLFLYGY